MSHFFRRVIVVLLLSSFIISSIGCGNQKVSQKKETEKTTSSVTNEKQILNITFIGPNEEFISFASKQFMQKYPNAIININKIPNLFTTDKFEQIFASPDSPDIICIDEGYEGIATKDRKNTISTGNYLKIEELLTSCAEKGMLLDISECIQPVQKNEGLIEGVVDSYQKDNKLYMLPSALTFPCIVGSSDTIEQLSALENKIPLFKVGQYSHKGLLLCIDPLISPDVYSSEEKLTEYLIQLKELAGQTKAVKEVTGTPNFDYIRLLESEESQTLLDELRNLSSFALDAQIANKSDKNLVITKQLFIPHNLVAINSKTRDRDLASLFITELLSEKIQSEITQGGANYGFPINLKSIDSLENCRLKNLFPIKTKAVVYSEDELEVAWPSEEDFQKFKLQMKAVQSPLTDNRDILNALMTHVDALMDGSKTPEEIAKLCIP